MNGSDWKPYMLWEEFAKFYIGLKTFYTMEKILSYAADNRYLFLISLGQTNQTFHQTFHLTFIKQMFDDMLD